MDEYHHQHHHHSITTNQTQERSSRLDTLRPSSLSISNSHTGHFPSSSSISSGDVPMTTSGPITISAVIALSLVICMILNCGKLKRKISPYCNTQPFIDRTKSTKQLELSSSTTTTAAAATASTTLSSLSPPSNYSASSSWPAVPSTFLYPKYPPPAVHQPQYARSYQPLYPYPIQQYHNTT